MQVSGQSHARKNRLDSTQKVEAIMSEYSIDGISTLKQLYEFSIHKMEVKESRAKQMRLM